MHVSENSRSAQHSAARAILCRVGSSCRPQLGLGLWFKGCVWVCVCVHAWCVWDKHSCCRGLYKCKEAVSVCFIRRTTDEGQVENPLHCECVRWACTKRGNKNREWGQNGECKGTDSPPPLLLFLSLSPSLPVSASLSRSWAVQMKCGPHVGPWTEGHRVFFSSCLSLNVLHLTLCFNANSSFISSPLLTCATWQGSLCNLPLSLWLPCHQSIRWQKHRFTACLFDYGTFTMVTFHVAPVKGMMVKR